MIVNTSGGLTGGDIFAASVDVAAGARAVVTTQACEKVYRSDGALASVTTRLALDEGASLAWLPQETILFDRSRLHRRLEVDMAAGSSLLLVEAVLLGRRASGERLSAGLFRDSWRIRQEGRLVFAEELRFDGDLATALGHRATLAGGAAFATVLAAGPDAAPVSRMPASWSAKKWLAMQAAEVGISSFDGLCVARLVAQDGARLRAALIPIIRILGGALPRVWSL